MTLADFRLPRPLRATTAQLARVVCPPDAEELGLLDSIVEHFELMIRAIPGHMRAGLLAGLGTLEVSTLPRRRRSFSRLPLEQAQEAFECFWHSPLAPVRALAHGLKALVVFGYFEHPTIKARLEFHPDRWIAETAKQRLASYADEIARRDAELTAPDPLLQIRKPAEVRHAR